MQLYCGSHDENCFSSGIYHIVIGGRPSCRDGISTLLVAETGTTTHNSLGGAFSPLDPVDTRNKKSLSMQGRGYAADAVV